MSLWAGMVLFIGSFLLGFGISAILTTVFLKVYVKAAQLTSNSSRAERSMGEPDNLKAMQMTSDEMLAQMESEDGQR